MRCGNCFNCSGKMIIQCEHIKGAVWAGAHKLPVFAQCDECGYAPLPQHQVQVVSALLREYLKHGRYVRTTSYVGQIERGEEAKHEESKHA